MDKETSAGEFKFLAIEFNIKEAVELEFMCKQPDKRPHVLSELSNSSLYGVSVNLSNHVHLNP